jgi:predicted negative regulator of RcsB-dependent stress response
VSDYNEQEQWERVKLWLRENGLWIGAGVLLGVGALVGWNAWQDRQQRIAEEAGTRYDQALDALDRNDRTRGLAILDEVARDHAGTAYADLATLAAARAHVDGNELDKAVAGLTQVMKESKDPELRLVSRLRLARVQSAQGKHDEALATLNGAEAGEFGPRFAEARGDILYAKGDTKGALEAYQAARTADKAGVVDVDVLDLKIRDLGGVPAESKSKADTAAPATSG